MKEVMVKAVALAKKMEGDWQARMKMALRMAWAIFKKSVKVVVNDLKAIANEIEESFLAESMIVVKANVWEKYGKRRIYVNESGLKVGFFEFDSNGNFVKAWAEYTDWNSGKTTGYFKTLKWCFENNCF